MNGLLANQAAVITGGSHGLGLAIAEAFVQAGAKVLLVGRDDAVLGQAAKSLRATQATVGTLVCDVTHPQASEKIGAAAKAQLGAWNTLVNCAGVFIWRPFVDLADADWEVSLATNLSAPFRLGLALTKHVIAVGGTGAVINIGSIHGFVGDGNAVPQCASKFGLVGLTKAMAEGCREHGVRVNAIAPGAIEADSPRRLSLTSEGRVTQADVAQLAVYLASDQARSITGATIEAFGLTRPVIASDAD